MKIWYTTQLGITAEVKGTIFFQGLGANSLDNVQWFNKSSSVHSHVNQSIHYVQQNGLYKSISKTLTYVLQDKNTVMCSACKIPQLVVKE